MYQLLTLKTLRTALGILATCLTAIAAEGTFPTASPVLTTVATLLLAVNHMLPRA